MHCVSYGHCALHIDGFFDMTLYSHKNKVSLCKVQKIKKCSLFKNMISKMIIDKWNKGNRNSLYSITGRVVVMANLVDVYQF